jgi:hypothetical protein
MQSSSKKHTTSLEERIAERRWGQGFSGSASRRKRGAGATNAQLRPGTSLRHQLTHPRFERPGDGHLVEVTEGRNDAANRKRNQEPRL